MLASIDPRASGRIYHPRFVNVAPELILKLFDWFGVIKKIDSSHELSRLLKLYLFYCHGFVIVKHG